MLERFGGSWANACFNKEQTSHADGSLPELAIGRTGLAKSLKRWLVPSDIELRDA